MDTYERIVNCVKRIKGNDFEYTENLISDGWIDSFGQIELIRELENEFNITIPLEKIFPEQFESIASIEELIKSEVRNSS